MTVLSGSSICLSFCASGIAAFRHRNNTTVCNRKVVFGYCLIDKNDQQFIALRENASVLYIPIHPSILSRGKKSQTLSLPQAVGTFPLIQQWFNSDVLFLRQYSSRRRGVCSTTEKGRFTPHTHTHAEILTRRRSSSVMRIAGKQIVGFFSPFFFRHERERKRKRALYGVCSEESAAPVRGKRDRSQLTNKSFF